MSKTQAVAKALKVKVADIRRIAKSLGLEGEHFGPDAIDQIKGCLDYESYVKRKDEEDRQAARRIFSSVTYR